MPKRNPVLALMVCTVLMAVHMIAPIAVLASGVVGSGSPESCTAAALSAVLAGGGDVTFNCGPSQYTIVGGPYTIATSTSMNGNGLVTLSANNVSRVFVVNAGATLTLTNLVVSDGNSGAGYGGCIYNNGGTLTLNNVTVKKCVTGAGFAGGGIDNNNGTVTLTNSVVKDNSSPFGGGIDSVGTLTLVNTVVTGNSASSNVGGGLDVGGTITISGSVIEGNTANRGGAGINATTASTMVINDSKISTNTSVIGGQFTPVGGGILNAGVLTLNRVTVNGNTADYGGGIFHDAPNGTLTIRDTTLNENTAGVHGGALYDNSGGVDILNTTFSSNTAAAGGGGIYHFGGSATVVHATFSGNRAQYAGAIYRDAQVGGTIQLARTVLADNQVGNCGGAIESGGYNLADDTFCGLEATTDLQTTDPQLAPLLSNGGATFTHAPAATSPAVDSAPADGCPPADQRGVPRPQGASCDRGAVEYNVTAPIAACGGVFAAVADSTINQANPDTNYGVDPQLQLSKNGGTAARSLLRFDLGSSIPAGATMNSAAIELTPVSNPPASVPIVSIAVQELAAAWDESKVTWNTAPALATSYDPIDHEVGSDVLRIDVTTLVNRWLTGAAPQNGVALLLGDTQTALAFDSREAANTPRLVVHCAPPIDAPVNDHAADDAAQAAAAARIKSESKDAATLQFGAGFLRFADFTITPPASVGADPLAKAQWFLQEYRNLLRLDDPNSELQLVRHSDDGLHLFFRQLHEGIPVFPANVVVSTDSSDILGLSGNYVPDIRVASTPTLDAERAEALALADAGDGAKLLGDTQLSYINLRLLDMDDDETHLAWQVHVAGADKQQTLYIDANSGALLLRLPYLNDGYDLDLEDGNNDAPQDLCSIFDDDDIGANDDPPDSVNATNNTRRVYDYWRNTFGRDSYDNDGEQIEMNIHVAFPSPNASYGVCDLFFFGYGMNTLDITAHEYTHAVDASESNLIYQNQSGALDESFADIFGHFVDNGNWTIGEGSAAGTLRDMSNPPAFGQPDRVANYVNTAGDNGGVHTNSGIPNKAAFLLIQGGAFNGFTVRGIGQGKAQGLYYNLLVNRVWSSAQFIDVRNLAVDEARNLAAKGTFGFTASDVCSVRNAYTAVGLGSGDRDCDGVEDNVDADLDGDYIPNAKDNCAQLFNPFQSDIDGDGQGDACDGDIDNDGRTNAQDNCPSAFNPGQADWNSNGSGDACDDTDGDSRIDTVDNCRSVFNPDQRDIDFDGKGDACDSDMDGDGRLNTVDNCPQNYNPGQADTTEIALGLAPDGVGDACDLCPAVSNSDNADIDNDGLANPCDDDDDGDGVPDSTDNCPRNSNANQLDTDKNGIGFICDKGEQRTFGKRLLALSNRYSLSASDFRFPVPICPECGVDILGRDFRTVINVQIPINFQARVVDSTGTVVSKGIGALGTQALSIRPAAFAITKLAAPGIQQTALPLGDPAPNEIRYYVELYPAPGTDLTQEYPVTISVAEQPNGPLELIYLPIVRK